MQMIDQVFPVKRQVPLEGLYLGQGLKELAAEIGRSVVLADYLTDENGVVAKAGKVPAELKNSSDWGRRRCLTDGKQRSRDGSACPSQLSAAAWISSFRESYVRAVEGS